MIGISRHTFATTARKIRLFVVLIFYRTRTNHPEIWNLQNEGIIQCKLNHTIS